MGAVQREGRCEEGEGYQALKKTRYIKGYKFSIFLVLLAVPFWVTGMIIDKEQKQPNQVADEILLVIGGALHGLAYFIIVQGQVVLSYLLLLPFLFLPNSMWCVYLRRFMDYGVIRACSSAKEHPLCCCL
jgi:hypothetical protein